MKIKLCLIKMPSLKGRTDFCSSWKPSWSPLTTVTPVSSSQGLGLGLQGELQGTGAMYQVQWSSLVNQRKPMSLNGKMLAETVAPITLLFPHWQNSRRRMKSGFPSLKWKKWKIFMRSLNFMLIFSFGKEKPLNYQSHTLQTEIESGWFP